MSYKSTEKHPVWAALHTPEGAGDYQKTYEKLIMETYDRSPEEARDRFHGSSLAAKILDELSKEEMHKTKKKSEVIEYHRRLEAAHVEIIRLREVIEEQDMEILSLQEERNLAYEKLDAIRKAVTKEKV